MKVTKRPTIEDLPNDLINVNFVFEDQTHVVRIHPFGSTHHFHSSRVIALISPASSDAERGVAYSKYIASLIEGWNEESNDFFGAPYSYSHALKICENPKNIWLVSEISKALDSDQKKS